VRYSSDLAEHHAVRSAAGIFDISHMAEFTIEGPDAAAFLDFALAGRLSAIAIGQAKYTLMLTEAGGIIDDLIVYRQAGQEFLIIANAGNHDPVLAGLLARSAGFDARVEDVSDAIALIAVQGPAALAVLRATPGLDAPGLAELRYYRHLDGSFDGVPLFIARTGYTGEDGFELYLRTESAVALWNALTTAGAPYGLVPAGLASRDTLRLEAGMPLYGHELGLDTFPEQAGLGRVVAVQKDAFVGKQAIQAGPPPGARVLVGLASEGKRAGRAGYPVLLDDDIVGEITSGALSPTLGHPIAMAYVDRAVSEPGTRVEIDVRGSRVAASVVRLPFYEREK
jgi:aminomethyltransferase